ncbi:MAG: hypothetical protein ABIO96_10135, partial [Nitrospiraceae bacterium]
AGRTDNDKDVGLNLMFRHLQGPPLNGQPSLTRMLKKSASLSCSFGLFGLSGLVGCIRLTRWTRQTGHVLDLSAAEVLLS